jgi:hypothetical protein
MVKPGAQSGFLAEIARERECADPPVADVCGGNRGERRICASVIDEQNFPAFVGGNAVEDRGDSLDERDDRLARPGRV